MATWKAQTQTRIRKITSSRCGARPKPIFCQNVLVIFSGAMPGFNRRRISHTKVICCDRAKCNVGQLKIWWVMTTRWCKVRHRKFWVSCFRLHVALASKDRPRPRPFPGKLSRWADFGKIASALLPWCKAF